jgi:branched-chain amino acid transport system substrate-binding protein
MYEAIERHGTDFSAVIAKMKQARIEAMFLGTYHSEAGNLLRQARAQGLDAQAIAADSLVTDEFWKIAGTAGKGTLMTYLPDAPRLPSALTVVAAFRAQSFNPQGYTLYAYAAVQAFKAAAEQAKSLEVGALSAALHVMTVDTVVGPLSWDAKGDVVNPKIAIYVWRNGRYFEFFLPR